MAYRIIFALTALFYYCGQVQSQFPCVTPGVVPQVITNTPLVTPPQVITTPIVATTIVDNSVSTALANALQLLIVSDIIESKLGASCLTNLFNLNPLETPCYGNRIEVIQPIAEYITPIAPCASPVEVISPCRSVIEPYPYLCGCNEILTPNFGFAPNCNPCGAEIISPCLPNVCIQDCVAPNRNYFNVAEFLTPSCNPYSCGVDVIAPACGTEIINIPSYNGCYRGYNELVTPIPYNSCGDIITPCCVEVNCPCGQYYGGVPEVITPVSPCNCGCYGIVPECVSPCNTFGGIREFISSFNPGCGVPEVITPCRQYYSGFPEVISPIYKPGCAGIPELLPANPFGPCREISTPCSNFPEVIIPNSCTTGCSGCDFCLPNFAPNFYGVQEIVNPVGSCAPVVAEVLIPPAIPAQLNCNFGYSPTFGPCVNFNVEPLPFGPGFCC